MYPKNFQNFLINFYILKKLKTFRMNFQKFSEVGNKKKKFKIVTYKQFFKFIQKILKKILINPRNFLKIIFKMIRKNYGNFLINSQNLFLKNFKIFLIFSK